MSSVPDATTNYEHSVSPSTPEDRGLPERASVALSFCVLPRADEVLVSPTCAGRAN